MQHLLQVLARALLRSAVVGGVELHEAGTGAEAVRRVRDGGGGAYDLIITDGKMPVMDGHEVRHAMRESKRANQQFTSIDDPLGAPRALWHLTGAPS